MTARSPTQFMRCCKPAYQAAGLVLFLLLFLFTIIEGVVSHSNILLCIAPSGYLQHVSYAEEQHHILAIRSICISHCTRFVL